MLKYVEPKFAFMSMFCLHILGVRKKRANFAACKPTQAYDWFPLVHLLQKGRSLLIHSDKSIELKHSLIWIWQPWWNIQKKVLSFTSPHVSFFYSFPFAWKAKNLVGKLSNGNWFPLIIPLTNLEQWPVPSDVDSRHNPDGGHLSKATPLYFYLYFCLYFMHCTMCVPYLWGCPAGLIDRPVLRVGTPQ